MTPAEMRSAKAKIADPKNWCQGAMSVDSAGEPVDPWDPRACAWCGAGAIWSIICPEGIFPVSLHLAAIRYGYPGAQLLNDMTSHASVMQMFDDAIKIEEESRNGLG